ncbi:hypothetical protein BAE44_0018229 [Dichanthelium oligosanthes]|uniref:Uncharacterized protein n=1 Tax=Dichanthelium oligosanthes TaxID=888268 RepID=A0A1E5V6H7_9POAL|nr:hypothetical protein BAE44_0018229 [Dichanthelium oligosanthes]
MYLLWVCLHGDVAAAVPLPRRPSSLAAAGGSHVLGSRPIPAGGTGGSSSPSSAARFGEDKRRIPSCPDALHNR